VSDEDSFAGKVKFYVWSMSAGVIVAFFFATNFLAWATNFNPGGSVLLISPLMCGIMLGIVTCEMDAVKTVTSTILLTVTASIGVITTLMAPFITGVVLDPSGSQLFIYVPQNMMITVILVMPLSLLGAVVGRLFAENTLLSKGIRAEREALKSETDEWYKMLEEKLEEKRAAIERLKSEQDPDMLNPKEPGEP
jgi:hypothetical protein